MSKGYDSNAEQIAKVEILDRYAFIVTYKDTYKCIFDFSELVPTSSIYKQFQDDPDSFYDYEVCSYKIAWKTIDFAADNIREYAVPFDNALLWIRNRMHTNFVNGGLRL